MAEPRPSPRPADPRARALWLRLLAAALAGVLLMLVSPPLNWWWLHYLNFVPVLWALERGDQRRNVLLGYAAGWAGEFAVFFWITDAIALHSNLPYAVALLVLGLYATLFGLPFAVTFGSVHFFRERIGRAWIFVVPAVQVAMERLSPALFPHYQGATQYRTLPVWQLASVTGVMGLTYLLFLGNCIVAELLYSRRYGDRKPWPEVGIFATLFLANLGFGTWRLQRIDAELATAPVIQVALLQQNVTMVERMETSAKDAFMSWVELTRKVAPLHPDLVVWPEGAFPGNPNDARHSEILGGLAAEGSFDFLVGGGTYEKNEPGSDRPFTAYNSCYHFTPEGELGGRYDKMRPLPFGEYMPLSDAFPVLKGLVEGIGDFRKGTNATMFQGRSYSFSSPICYEAILDGTMWKLAAADLFVNITNDAWFGNTAAPHQHAMLAAVQSIQFGRPMVRIAYTGVCMLVEPDGSIVAETEPFTDVADVQPLRLLTIDTVFRRGGWLFPWVCVAVSALAFAWASFLWRAARIDETVGSSPRDVTPKSPAT
jgi:apolipoprotein N-acyltransferase